MLAIPFPLERVPAETAVETCNRLISEHPGTTPVLLGDADVFSVEWAESVDDFEDPEIILAEAENIDADAWFAARRPKSRAANSFKDNSDTLDLGWRIAALPLDLLLAPARLAQWAIRRKRPQFLSPTPSNKRQADNPGPASTIERLRAQLSELEATSEGSEDELREIRDVIAAIEAEGCGLSIFPDPIDYVTPRHADTLAAGLIAADAPWKAAAWLQHGTYSLLAPKPVLVAHCRWLWETHGARLITASTDHLGFEVARPPQSEAEAREVLSRFFTLCADEVNAENRGTDGSSLIGTPRWWVWWD